jgi:hypothetical protein
MKTAILFFFGMLLMSCFGSEIANVIKPSKSWAGRLLIPGYSLGLIVVSLALFNQLNSQVKELKSKIEKLESKPGASQPTAQ